MEEKIDERGAWGIDEDDLRRYSHDTPNAAMAHEINAVERLWTQQEKDTSDNE